MNVHIIRWPFCLYPFWASEYSPSQGPRISDCLRLSVYLQEKILILTKCDISDILERLWSVKCTCWTDPVTLHILHLNGTKIIHLLVTANTQRLAPWILTYRSVTVFILYSYSNNYVLYETRLHKLLML